MAFLDETGLAELWSLIKAEDEKITACKPLLDVTTDGSYLATYTLADSVENYAALLIQLCNFSTKTDSSTTVTLSIGTAAGKSIATAPCASAGGSEYAMGIVLVGNYITSLSGTNGTTYLYRNKVTKSAVDDLTKVTLSGNSIYGIAAGATIKIWGLK